MKKIAPAKRNGIFSLGNGIFKMVLNFLFCFEFGLVLSDDYSISYSK